jgi:uncharacterized protein YbjT (DUF2867 family)
MEKKSAIIIGASGLIGGFLTKALLKNAEYSKIKLLVRKKIPIDHPKLSQVIFDFENPDKKEIVCDDLFCTIGTTLKKAGSKEAQYHIDYEIPYKIGEFAKENNVKQYLLVSSLGANLNSGNFYLKTKGELEHKLKLLYFDTFIVVRPSILYGERKEIRFFEKIGVFFSKLISPLLFGKLKKYAGIEASKVADALIYFANNHLIGNHFFESDELNKLD